MIETTEGKLEDMLEAKVMLEQEVEEIVSDAQEKEQRLKDEIIEKQNRNLQVIRSWRTLLSLMA